MKFVIIKDRKSFIRKRLDEETSFSCQGFSIYYHKNRFYLIAMNGFHLEDGRKLCRLEDRKYTICADQKFHQYEVYVYQSDEGVDDFSFYMTEDFVVSPTPDSRIVTSDPYLESGRLSFSDGRIETDLDVSVNKGSYDGLQLKIGDLIEYLGIRIFFYGDFLYINHFMLDIHLSPYPIRYSRLHYTHRSHERTFYQNISVKPLILPKFREFRPLDETRKTGIVRTILPALVMSLSIFAAALFSSFENRDRFAYSTASLIYIISPIATILTGVILPLLFYIFDWKRERREIGKHEENYLAYLKEYQNETDSAIEKHVSSLSEQGFSVDDEKKKPFHLNECDERFLYITIGKIYENESFSHRTGIGKIDILLRLIEGRLSHIGPVPLFLDLKKERFVTVVSSKKDRQYFFFRFLLELAFKHDSEDLCVAVYSKDSESISDFHDLRI